MDSSSLASDKAADIWRERSPEVFTIILATLKRMGFAKSLARTFERIAKEGRALPSTRQLRIALIEAVDFHVEVYECVERAFHKAMAEGRVDQDRIGGWLNQTTRRQTWKRAEPRARAVAYELSALSTVNGGLENAAGPDLSPDELIILRDFSSRYAVLLASLSIQERMLIDAKLVNRGYADLAVAWGRTEAALKTQVSRLLVTLRAKLEMGESTVVPARGA